MWVACGVLEPEIGASHERRSYRGVGGRAGVDDKSEVVRQCRRFGADTDAVRHRKPLQLFLDDAATRRPVVRHRAVHVATQSTHLYTPHTHTDTHTHTHMECTVEDDGLRHR